MRIIGRQKAKALVWVLVVLCLAGVASLVVGMNRTASQSAPVAASRAFSFQLVEGKTDTLKLEPRVVENLGIRTVQVQTAGSHDTLRLSGSLLLDSNRMVRVHSRFPGEVVTIGGVPATESGAKLHETRLLRLGDRVTRGQLLAVIWSKDVGEKKSDLVNAMSKLYLDEAQLNSLKSLGADVVARVKIREAEREREADIIEVDRVERTLRSWRLSEAEINIVRAEAKKIHEGDVVADMEVDKSWAEIEVRCPFEGIILEKNIVAGDIVDTNLDLFKIADLRVLGVIANVFEEDLPALESLHAEDRRWTISLKAQPDAPGISGRFDLIGNIIDPNQHTAAVMGWLDNSSGRLRAGQFITATVELPAEANEVRIPDTALIEDGPKCMVFVASDPAAKQVTRRTVALVSRGSDVAFVKAEPSASERAQGCVALQPGDWVVASGSVELDGALERALTTDAQHKPLEN